MASATSATSAAAKDHCPQRLVDLLLYVIGIQQASLGSHSLPAPPRPTHQAADGEATAFYGLALDLRGRTASQNAVGPPGVGVASNAPTTIPADPTIYEEPVGRNPKCAHQHDPPYLVRVCAQR